MSDHPRAVGDNDETVAALAGWQERLHLHFESLADERRASGWPVFALEHGLTDAEARTLEADVRSSIRNGASLSLSPLPWVVYCAEFGYRYDGDEYWQTFASETLGWRNADAERRLVRRKFQNFAARYYGAEPEGRWAEFFKNIAWPITHAVLPRDLQRQLAQLLYDARLSFRADLFDSPEALGRHLRDRSAHRSARFQQFAENTTLLGQISGALLLQDEGQGKANALPASPSRAQDRTAPSAGDGVGTQATLLQPGALARIVADLTREREARDWLTEARDAARAAAQLRLRGLRRELSTNSRPGSGSSLGERALGGRTADFTTGLEPRLVLREDAKGEWHVWVEFPNLRSVADLLPTARNVLAGQQGRVGGPGGVLLARGRVLAEAKPAVALATWPAPETALLSFDGAPPELRTLLEASFRGPPGESWLFKLANDGQAYEVKHRLVRPGSSYILLRRTPTERPAPGLTRAEVACIGVYALRIDMPSAVPETLAGLLDVLELSIGRSVRIWPAGLPVPSWSDDGEAEYLAGDRVLLGIRSDYAIEKMSLSVDGEPSQDLRAEPLSPGVPRFIALGELREGRHRIAITTRAPVVVPGKPAGEGGGPVAPRETSNWTPDDSERDVGGVLELVVRPVRSVGVDGGSCGALSFAVYPDPPSLEDLWEGRCEVHLAVPGASTVRCRVALFERAVARQIWAAPLPPLAVPLDTSAWRTAFLCHVRKHASDQYDAAHSCQVDFNAGPLGWVRITAERDFTPLRWAVRDVGRRVVLVDSVGADAVELRSFDSRTPDIERPVAVVDAESGVAVEAGGALFTASAGGVVASVVVVPPQHLRGLADLVLRPQVAPRMRAATDLAPLVETAGLWEAARLSASPLAEVRRTHAVAALLGRLFGVIGGERWATAEEALESQTDIARAAVIMKPIVAGRKSEEGVAAALARRAGELADAGPEARVSVFNDVLGAFLGDQVRADLTEFAVRLAGSPASAVKWLLLREGAPIGGGLRAMQARLLQLLDALLALPVVARSARFCAVVTAAEVARRHPADIGSVGDAWRWE